MAKTLSTLRSKVNNLRDVLFRSLFRARFRYDIFISYNHSSKVYAVSLKKQLAQLDFSCFIDEEEAPPGSSLDPILAKALKKSAVLVLLATERALTRPYITLEFEKFVATGRRIIPINICGALSANDEAALRREPWKIIKSRNLIWIDESDEAFAKQNPSPSIADGIDKLFKYTRRNSRVRAEIIGTAALVVLAAIGAGFVIKGQAKEVSRQSALANTARGEAARQQSVANEAGKEAQRQLGLAARAAKEAERQGQIAETAKREADHQLEVARTATAEADKQQRLAKEAKAEADRQQAIAEAQLERSRRLLYVSDLNVARSAREGGEVTRVYELLNAHFPNSKSTKPDDLRSFYWYYLWRNSYNEIAVLKGHGAPVISVDFSPDGQILAAAGKQVTLWDVATRKELMTFAGKSFTAVAFSPVGKLLAMGSDEGAVTLYDLQARRELGILKGVDGLIWSMAFSPDGQTFAWTNGGPEIVLWDVPTMKQRYRIKHQNGVLSVAFSPDGKILATGSEGTTHLWEVSTGKPIATFPGHEGAVLSVAFSPNGLLLATGSADSTIKLWDIKAGFELATLRGHIQEAYRVAFSPDGRTIASAGTDKTVRLWDVEKRQQIVALGGQEAATSLAFSPDGRTLATGSTDQSIGLWNLAGRREEVLGGHKRAVSSLAFSPDDKIIATGSGDKTAKLWNLADQTELAILPHANGVESVAFSPDGELLATGGVDHSATIWDVRARTQIAKFTGHTGTIAALEFSPNGRMLVTAGIDKMVKLWDVKERREVATLKHSKEVASVRFSLDGKTLATVESGNDDDVASVRLWDLATLTERASFNVQNRFRAAFSPDMKVLATTLRNQSVKLWQVDTGKEIATLAGHSNFVTAVAFSPDGRTIATTGLDQVVKLWDLSTAQELATLKDPALKDPSTFVIDLRFSHDGRTLAVVADNGSVKLWVAATDADVAAQRK